MRSKAANDLDAFIARRPVSCTPISLDQYRRTVATCSVGDIDLGEWLARNSLALDWPQYSRQKYDPAQRKLSTRGEVCGRAVTSSHGYIAYASEQAGARQTAQTTPLRAGSDV
jgi:hypothetical protein